MNGMVSCKHCMAHNSLDSTFCKKCGETLPDDDIQQAKEKLESTVADGFKIFSAGRTDEAMQIAENAVVANPLSTAALSLKAMCHERVGQIAEALECHERVLEIDPDSMIDKIKVKDLKNLLVARSSLAAVPDRRLAIMSAVAAFVLVASMMLVFARSGAGKADEKVATNTPASSASQSVKGSQFEPVNAAPNGQPQTQEAPAGQQQPSQAEKQNPAPQQETQTSHSSSPESVHLPAFNSPRGRQLPDPSQGGADDGNKPLTVVPDEALKAALKGSNATSGSGVATHPSANSGIDPQPQPEEQPKSDPPGVMEISVVGHGAKGADSNDPGSHPNGVEALIRTARNQYQIGNFASAATSYERALRAGADPASGNQRLAQCYEKLGRNSEAVAAYNRAIDALQSAIDSGRGDKDRLGAALDSCKQAVKVLGG